MSDSAISDIAPIAARILSTALDQPVSLDYAGRLHNRSDICRFNILEGQDTAPSGVVVKIVSAADSRSIVPGDLVRLDSLFYSEWAGLTLLQQLMADSPLIPRIYGGDPEKRMLVMEDLGTSPTLWDQLQGHDSQAATTQLVALARALGRMHAGTIGEQPRFQQIRAALASDQSSTDFDHYNWIGPTFQAAAATLGIPLLPTVMDELATLTQILTEPGSFGAYTQGDPSPGNCLFVAPTMRLLDFGTGAYRHAFVDFPPPWCWQRIPPSVMQQMISAYQMALAEGCAAATDPLRFARGLVEGCVYWSMTLLKDWPLAEVAVNAGMRQNMLHVLESFVELSRQTAHLEGLGAMTTAIVEAIGRRWPVDSSGPRYYPAFQEYLI